MTKPISSRDVEWQGWTEGSRFGERYRRQPLFDDRRAQRERRLRLPEFEQGVHPGVTGGQSVLDLAAVRKYWDGEETT